MTDRNAKFKIAEFENADGKERKSIYMLNPKDTFEGFGGSSAGKLVQKTASLIVRESGPFGTHDCEYDIADAKAWRGIFHVARNWQQII